MGRDPEITHKIMSSIKSSNTVPELLLRKAVWRMGMRYRINDRQIYGKPDIIFSRVKLAVFCDGDYWHGHNWALRGYANLEDELAHYKPFWADKIRRNVRRDREVDEKLSCEGWSILRFWESDILRDPQECAQEVFKKYQELDTTKGTTMNNNEGV